MSGTKYNKHDNAKNRPGPASGRPGAEGSRSDKASRPPVQQPNDQRDQSGAPKGRQTPRGGQRGAGSD